MSRAAAAEATAAAAAATRTAAEAAAAMVAAATAAAAAVAARQRRLRTSTVAAVRTRVAAVGPLVLALAEQYSCAFIRGGGVGRSPARPLSYAAGGVVGPAGTVDARLASSLIACALGRAAPALATVAAVANVVPASAAAAATEHLSCAPARRGEPRTARLAVMWCDTQSAQKDWERWAI